MTFARHVYPGLRQHLTAVQYHTPRWVWRIGGTVCAICNSSAPHSPAATAAPTSQEGGENIMHLILNIDGVDHEFTEVNGATAAAAAPATLTIKRPFVVYDVNGDRVDGYKYESRARRNNDARFAGTGYWLGNANTGDFEFVSA